MAEPHSVAVWDMREEYDEETGEVEERLESDSYTNWKEE